MDNNIYSFLGKDLYKLNSSPTEVSSVVNPSSIDSGTSTGFQELGYGGIKQGKTAFDNTETGFILGIDGNLAKFYIGNTTNYLNWTGATLTIQGTFNIGGTVITIDNTQDIQTYIDTIYTAGGGILYLQNGTYTLTADVTIPSGVTLQGVNRDDVIINCNTSYAVKIAGTNIYSTGTVTINNGQTTLEGVGTTWTTEMVDRYVLLDGLWYLITGRTDNDTLTIATYNGVNLTGSAYVIASTNFNASLVKVTVTGATGSGVVCQYANEPNLTDLVVYECGTGVDLDYVVYPRMYFASIENGVNLDMNFVEGFEINFADCSLSTTGAGVVMTDTRNATFFNSSVNDNTGDGINMTTCSKIAFISMDISGNGGQGVEFVSGCNDNQLTDIVLDGNISDNIKLTATSDRNQFIGVSSINAGGYGINIAAATCDNNVINSPTFSTNTSGNINDAGTLTVIIADDTAYNATTWNGNLGVATKNAIRDKIETLAGTIVDGSGTLNEISYWVDSNTLGTLAVATYPSLTELSYIKGLSSAVQTQLGTKAPTTAPTFATSITGSYLTASEILITDASKNIISAPVATYPSLTELSYVKGVTSAIQTQLNALSAPIFKNGVTTKDMTAASATVNIAHGLGKIPKKIRITSYLPYTAAAAGFYSVNSVGVYDGTTTSTMVTFRTAAGGANLDMATSTTNIVDLRTNESSGEDKQQATVTVDATNIILVYTKTASPTGTALIVWEAEV